MKMKNIILLILISSLTLIVSCTKQKDYDIPLDENGKVLIFGISSSTSTGITTLDASFTVNVTFATAKAGDIMNVELLKSQIPPMGGTAQWLPLEGTKKTVTLGSDLKASVTYTRAEAQMTVAGDAVKVAFSGDTDWNLSQVTMASASIVSTPNVSNIKVVVVRSSDTAYFNVAVSPKSGAYTGTVIAKRKNGGNGVWVDVGTGAYTVPALVPISGNDFAAGKDTMYYKFTATSGAYTDEYQTTIVVTNPYFYLKKSGILTLGATTGGLNILLNEGVAATADKAIIAIDGGSLTLHGGSAWLALAGKSIQFVPSTLALYGKNSSDDVKAAYAAGSPTGTSDPIAGEGVYIFKIVNGPNTSDIFYGMIRVTGITPGVSVAYEYRIGNLYKHLLVIK